MAKIRFYGLEGYIQTLEHLASPRAVLGTMKAAVYPGAGIIADEIRKQLMHRLEGNAYLRASDESKDTRERTGDLLNSLYLSEMQEEDGYVYSQIGFAGYDSKGVPNAIKAAALESGTSQGQNKTPFIRPALKIATKKAEAAMEAELDRRVRIVMEE